MARPGHFSKRVQKARLQRKRKIRLSDKEKIIAVNKFLEGQLLNEKQITHVENYYVKKVQQGTVNTKRDALGNLHVLDPALENPRIKLLIEKRAESDESSLVQKVAQEILNRSRQKKEKKAV